MLSNEDLVSFFETKKKKAQHIDPSCLPLVEQIAELTLRSSKRIRPYLVELGYQAVIARIPSLARETRQSTTKTEIASPLERTRNDMVLHAMLAVELFHTFALIHDDIMDDDDQRRGGPTVHEHFHVACRMLHVTCKNPKHFGESMAILAGDLALVWADELMGKACFRNTPDVKEISHTSGVSGKKTWELYQQMKEEVAFGQSLDVMKQSGYKNISQDKINELKTAWYSVVRPLQIGAALAGAPGQILAKLVDYGVPVGMLFQLKDDLMDKEISQKEFDQRIIPLQKKVKVALGALGDPKDLTDFVKFVIERTS